MTTGDQRVSSSRTRSTTERRAAIVAAVKTPLGFFALVVLVVEGILAVTASVTDGLDRRILVIGMISLIGSLVLVVTALAIWRPDALYGKRPAVTIDVRQYQGSHFAIGAASEDASTIATIRQPRFLIAGAPGDPWDSFARDNRRIIEEAFPGAQIQTHLDATATTLSQELLRHGKYDVVQLVGQVDPQGNIELGDTILAAKGFSRLIDQSGVKIVVLSACSSATLAAEVAPYSNMVAATGNLAADGWSQWSLIFYSLLANGIPLSQSYSIAQAVVDLPVAMILHRDTRIVQ